MNIIIANKYKDLIDNANIEVIKELKGVFSVSEIANNFNSIFYKKLIIDATSLKGFPKSEVLRELASKFDTEKLILFLPPDNPPPKNFLSFLVSINIYNFTDNISGVVGLINKGNSYDDVDEYSKKDSYDLNNNQDNSLDFSDNKINMENGRVILGIKNVTLNSGSTTLVYLLKRALEEVYKVNVLALELNKRDFVYYKAPNMYSTTTDKYYTFINNFSANGIILIDLGDDGNTELCTDVLYLVDPSMYKINELMFKDRHIFNTLRGRKVILNNCLLNSNDVRVFSKEAGISVYYTLPPLNDRVLNPILNNLLEKLGLVDENPNEKGKKGIFDIFK